METLILKNWQYIVIAILAAACCWLFSLWQGEVRDFAEFKGGIVVLGQEAEKHAKKVEEDQRNALKETNDAWKRQLPSIRETAIDNYARRFPRGLCGNPSSGNLSGAPDDPQVPPGAVKERVAAGVPQELEILGDFIEDCAVDAGRIVKLREWAAKVGIKPSAD